MSISAVIPAHNAQDHIERSIRSVLNQTCPVDEIIVVDDGSTDNTAEAVQRFGEQVRYIRQDNAGASAARNTGIQAAASDWIAFLDADDEWVTNKIQLQVDILAHQPHLVWTSGNYIDCLCDEQRKADHAPQSKCLHWLKGKAYYDSFFEAIQFKPWGCMDCMLIRKDALVEVGLFHVGLPKANDIDMWLRVAYRYPRIGYSAQPLAIYHRSTQNSIVKKYRKTRIYTDFMKRHFEIAENETMLEPFRPAATFFMKEWIRRLLFEGRRDEIRELLDTFPDSFSPLYRLLVKTFTVFPRGTAFGLHQISKIVRTLNLRRRVIPRPASPRD